MRRKIRRKRDGGRVNRTGARGVPGRTMNPKYAEKCQQCGAMKPLGAGSEVFHNNISDEQYLKNQSRRVGK